MKRQYIFGTMLSIALAAGVAAQEPAVGARPSAQSGSDSPQTVTMTGCLQSASAAGSASSTGTGSTTAGTAGTATSGTASAGATRSGGYILTNAAMASAAGA